MYIYISQYNQIKVSMRVISIQPMDIVAEVSFKKKKIKQIKIFYTLVCYSTCVKRFDINTHLYEKFVF